MLYEYLSQHLGSHDGGAANGASAEATPLPLARPSQHTLSPNDLTPTWRPPSSRKDGRTRSADYKTPFLMRPPHGGQPKRAHPQAPGAVGPGDRSFSAAGIRRYYVIPPIYSYARSHDYSLIQTLRRSTRSSAICPPRRLGGPLPLCDRAGRALPRCPSARTEANKVRGCASQVWLATSVPPERRRAARSSASRATAMPTSCAGSSPSCSPCTPTRPPRRSWASTRIAVRGAGPAEHLTPQRSNGFFSMVERIRADSAKSRSGKPGQQFPTIVRSLELARHLPGCLWWPRSNPPRNERGC